MVLKLIVNLRVHLVVGRNLDQCCSRVPTPAKIRLYSIASSAVGDDESSKTVSLPLGHLSMFLFSEARALKP